MGELSAGSVEPVRFRVQLSLCWLWFFLVLFSYYCVKPVRDALGTAWSNELGQLYFATFVSVIAALSVYSYLIARWGRLWLLTSVYQFFGLCMLGFLMILPDLNSCPQGLAAVFFVWVSVFNLFVVTLFWSAMADLFSQISGRRWFGILASAGSLGSISGSFLASRVVQTADPRTLIWIALVALQLAYVVGCCVLRSRSTVFGSADATRADGTGGSWFDGFRRVLANRYLLAICLFVALGKLAATLIYNQLQLELKSSGITAEAGTALFARINSYSQTGSFAAQLLAAGLLLRFLGVGWTLMIPCGVYVGLFAWMMAQPNLSTLISAQVWQQIVSYGILVPAQHVLFTIVPRDDKYKSKGFIDTVVFRGSDVAAANLVSGLSRQGVTLAAMAGLMLPVAGVWTALGLALGWMFRQRLPATVTSPERDHEMAPATRST
jgi:AAA family ATP:ADP antiporter